MFNVQCSMFNVQCSMFNVQSSMFNVQCSMFNVQCSMFTSVVSTMKCYLNVILNLFQDLLVFRRLREEPETSSGRNDAIASSDC